MAVLTLRAVRSEARAISVPALALAAGDPTGNAILALDLGQKTGWAVRNSDGAIASGTVEFKPGRFEGGGMVFLRFRAWLQEVDETAGGIGAVYFEEVRFHRGVTAAHVHGGFLAQPMIGPAGYRSCLARAQAHTAPSDEDLLAMRRAAWRSQGVVVLRPQDVRDDWTRQALINEANRLYGRRPGGDR